MTTLTAERLKAIRLEIAVRRHGGFLLLEGDELRLYGNPARMPRWIVQEVTGAKNEMARFLKFSFDAQCREVQ